MSEDPDSGGPSASASSSSRRNRVDDNYSNEPLGMWYPHPYTQISCTETLIIPSFNV